LTPTSFCASCWTTTPNSLPVRRVFGERNVDFADAYLVALSLSLTLPVATFDQDLQKLGTNLLVP
jgi:predicted nucleic acid-binding protein